MADEANDQFSKLPLPDPDQISGDGDMSGDGDSPVTHARHDAVPAPVIVDGADEDETDGQLPFNVVAIGASAGGVEAYIQLFDHLPANTGMAYVVVPHLASDQKSLLRQIISRHTLMPVTEIKPGLRPEPDNVYLIPANAQLSIHRGTFRTEPRDGTHWVIDNFFRSLSSDQKNRAVGVVLSGMDGDGALGLRAIKGEGGIAMVQSPESARFPDMPRTSISADHVDVILPPDAIAAQLGQLGQRSRATSLRMLQDGAVTSDEERLFARILSLLRNVSGVDFRLYKQATVRRRVARRMLLHRIDSLSDYIALLLANPHEVKDLHQDALINVTYFFRDPDVFESLKNIVLPRLFEHREPAQQVRIWVAGCSSGEEVYSIAICLIEYLTNSPFEPPIQIFGTDASEQNIQRARAGIYPETIAAEVSPERLRRFFVKTEKGYQVAKRLRDLCIFARQNLCHDPPFSRMDLISCRNVLIYFGAELQRQLIPTFHYALRPDTYLLLGTSETIREFTGLFHLVHRKHKIYARTGDGTRILPDALPRIHLPHAPAIQQVPAPEVWGDLELQRAADRIVLARYGPAGVIVNERLEILQSRGHTSPYLEMRQGAATLQLARMAREGIAHELTNAVRRAIEHDLPVQVQGLQVSDGDLTRETTLEVLPIHSLTHRHKCYLVLFAPAHRAPVEDALVESVAGSETVEEKDRLIAQMRHDLSSTRLYLQSLLEERDGKNQELVSANEEIQSANEELQSTNEELETTKEELQSSNEELHTVNDELQNRNSVLTEASNDLHNLLNSVNMPVLMLSNELNIRHFTPLTQRVMSVRSSDIGRPFADIRMTLEVDDLAPLFHEVLDTLGPREIEVKDRDGHWYLLRVRPYRTADNKIEGLVIVLVDIDQLRRSQQELRAARDFAGSVIVSIPLPLAVIDLEFKIRSVNEAFSTLTGFKGQELERRLLSDVTSLLWGLDNSLRLHLEELRTAGDLAKSFEFEYQMSGENARTFAIRGRLLQPDGEQFVLVTFEDITAHKEAERLLKVEKEYLAIEVESTTRALGRTQDDLRALTSSLFNTQEDEHRRLARELHDDVSQRLAFLEIASDEVQQSISVDPAAAQEKLQQLRTQVKALAEDVRNMSHRLHPSIIEDLGLAPALRTLTEDFDRGEKMIATFSAADVPVAIPQEVATGLYRIAQEALRNVTKHAGRTHVRVALRGTKTGVQLEIEDTGHGFDIKENRHGLGLISMEERTRMIGGVLTINSALGRGTKVVVNVPLQPSK